MKTNKPLKPLLDLLITNSYFVNIKVIEIPNMSIWIRTDTEYYITDKINSKYKTTHFLQWHIQ